MSTSIQDKESKLDSYFTTTGSTPAAQSSSGESKLDSYFTDSSSIKQPTEVEVDEKATPATLGNNETWLASAKAIYEDEVGRPFDPEEADYDNISDWFENRHSKYNWQLWDAGKTAYEIGDKSDEVKQAWLDSMSIYDESDTNAGTIFRGLKNLIIDPVNLATLGVGLGAKILGGKALNVLGKEAFKQSLRKQLQGKVSKETIEEIIKTKGSKEISEELLKTTVNKAALKELGKRAVAPSLTGAAWGGAADVAEQTMQLGLLLPENVANDENISIEEAKKVIAQRKEEGINLMRTGLVAGATGVFTALLPGAPRYISRKLGGRKGAKQSRQASEDLVEVVYRPKGKTDDVLRAEAEAQAAKTYKDPAQRTREADKIFDDLRNKEDKIGESTSIVEKMTREKFNKLSESEAIGAIVGKSITERPLASRTASKNPKVNIDGEQLIERTLPDGSVVQTLRQKLTERLGNIGSNRLGNTNTFLGRFLTSTAALPPAIAKLARERSNAVRAAQMKIESSLQTLKDIQKKEGVSDIAIAKLVNENDNRLLTGSPETLKQVEKIRDDIFNNQEAINTLAGKKTDDVLRAEAETKAAKAYKDPAQRAKEADKIFNDLRNKEDKIGVAFGKDGGYYFRTYEASHNPKYLKEIKKVLRGKGVPDAKFDRKVQDFISYLRKTEEFKNAKDAELDDATLALVNRLTKEDTNLFETPFKVLEDILAKSSGAQTGAKIGNRKDLDIAVRNLLGEVTDPYAKITQTLAKQNRIIGELEYASGVNKFFQKVLAKNSGVNLELGGLVNAFPTRAARVSREKLGGGEESLPLSSLYENVLGADFVKKGVNFKQLPKEIYVDKEMDELIRNGFESVFPSLDKKTGGLGDAIWGGLQQAAAFGQSTQTILDAPAYAINAYGAVQNLIASGHLFNRAAWKSLYTAGKEMSKGLRNKDPEVLEYMTKLKRSGVIDSDLTSEMIIRNINQNSGSVTGGPFAKVYKKGMEKASRAYGVPDTYAKIIAHKAETAALKKMFPKKSADEIFDLASERVINTMPTYGAANPLARSLGRIPFGTYALFPTEMLRTTKNIVKYAVKDVKEGIATGNKAQVTNGMRKIVGLGATGGGIGAVIDTNNTTLGITEEDKRGMDAIAADWGKGGNPYYLQGIAEDDQGKIITRNVRSANFDAQDYLKVPLRLMTGKILAGEDVTDLEIDDAFKAMGGAILGPYTSTKFIYEALANVVTGVDLETGRDIYSDIGTDAGFSSENIKRAIIELGGSLIPGTLEPLIKYSESKDAAEVTKDGEGLSRSGFPLRENDILTWAFSGIRPVTIDVKKSMGYKLSNQIKDMSKSKKAFENLIRTMPVKDYSKPENLQKILDEYTKFQELKLGSSKRLADMIGLFKDINYTDSGGERRKFGLEQVIMAATNDGFYKNKEGVDAIALADAELDNYRRGIFLPDDINDSDNFIKMLTDKGVPLSILGELAKINRTYYDRGNEGLVKMAEGGSITDMLPTVNVVAPPIARGSFKLPSLEDLREKELAMGRGVKETEVEPTVTPVEFAPVLPNVIPEVEAGVEDFGYKGPEVDGDVAAPLPPEKPPVPEDSAILKLEDVADDTDVFDDDSKNIMFNDVIERLGVKPDNQKKAYKNLEKFAELTRNTESSNKYKAVNIPVDGEEATTAKGAYQFVDRSIVPALNRLKRLIGEQPWMTELRKSNDIFSLTNRQQDLLFFGDMFEKTVSETPGLGDKLLKRIMKGDKNAMFQMYKKAHHTGKLPRKALKNARRNFLKGNK